MQPVSIRNLGIYGVIRPAEVSDELIPDGAVTEVKNFSFDRKGVSTVRSGLTGLGSTVLNARPCVGLHNAQSGTAISVFSNGATATIYTLSSGTWGMSLDGGTASVSIRFVDFGSYTIALNFMYDTYSSMRFWNAGSSRHWHHTGNPINPQNMWGYAPQLGEVYKSRIYLAGDTSKEGNGSRLYFSSVITSAGNITWTPTSDFVDINPGDGEVISALKRFSLELLVFKPNYIYRFRTTGVDPDPLIKIGTRSQESVVEGKKGLYFHHDTGFYRYSGGYPTEISRPISDFIAAIPFSQFSQIASWNDQDHIFWSIGNVTTADDSVLWRNTVLRFTESSEVWTIYSYASDLRRGATFNSGSSITRIVGTDYGLVATLDSGTTDFGHPINYRIRTKWYELEGIENRKLIERLVAICEKAQGSELMYQVDDDSAWRTIGQVREFINFFDNTNIRFHRIKFQLTGVSRNEPPIFKGLEIIEGKNEGIVE